MRIVAVVPFFGGTSSATHSLEETRLDYLARTRESLSVLGIQSYVFQAEKDSVDVPGSVRLRVDPVWLPWATMVKVQGDHEKHPSDADLIYVTEADQILHVEDSDVWEIPTESRYLAPWRLDLVGPQGECESATAPKIRMDDGATYSITNGAHRASGARDVLVDQHAQQQAFSGCFFATPEYFRRITFRKMNMLPVEHATGFDAKSAGACVKTADILRCWVDHLSPRDRWKEVNE